jgi:hypothetical protein
MIAEKRSVDLDALLCALVLAPRAFSRNRFFWLFERDGARRTRRRAARIRGILKQLINGAELTGELELDDGRLLLRYRVASLGLSRTAALSRLEAATLRFAMSRARGEKPATTDREAVEIALERLAGELGGLPELTPLERGE